MKLTKAQGRIVEIINARACVTLDTVTSMYGGNGWKITTGNESIKPSPVTMRKLVEKGVIVKVKFKNNNEHYSLASGSEFRK